MIYDQCFKSVKSLNCSLGQGQTVSEEYIYNLCSDMMAPNFHPKRERVLIFNSHFLHPGSHKGLKVTWHIKLNCWKWEAQVRHTLFCCAYRACCKVLFKERKTSLKLQNHIISVPQAKIPTTHRGTFRHVSTLQWKKWDFIWKVKLLSGLVFMGASCHIVFW